MLTWNNIQIQSIYSNGFSQFTQRMIQNITNIHKQNTCKTTMIFVLTEKIKKNGKKQSVSQQLLTNVKQLPKLQGRDLKQKMSASLFPVLYFLIKRTREIK